MDTAAVIELAAKCLIENGWSKRSHLGMQINGKNFPVYEKTFETATVPQTAFICCRESSDPDTVVFDSTYYSEGRNVLSGCSAYGMINDLTAMNVGIETAISRYIENAERAIDQSYARRLFLTRDVAE